MHYVNEYDRPAGQPAKLVHTFGGYPKSEDAEASADKYRTDARALGLFEMRTA